MPRLNPPPTGMKDIWVRFTSKESPNFEHGRSGCGGRSYKFFLVQFECGTCLNPLYRVNGIQGRVGTYLGDQSSLSMIPTNLWMDLNDNIGSPGVQPTPSSIGGEVSWGGKYVTWTLGLEGIGTSAAKFSVYKDGVLVRAISASFLNGQTVGGGWAVTLEMGSNINSGPDHAQSRWWKEFAVLTAKPSNLP